MSDLSKLSDDELLALARAQMGAAARAMMPKPSQGESLGALETAEDVGKSYGSGVVRGVTGIAGIGGDITKGMRSLVEMAEAQGATRPNIPWMPKELPVTGSKEMMEGIDRATGMPITSYEPKSGAGGVAQTLGEFTPNLVSPGSLGYRVVGGVVGPALGSELGEHFTKGTAAEPIGKMGGAVLGGLGGSAAMAARNANRSYIPDMSPASSRVLEKHLPPEAQARLGELGPDAFLFEGSPSAVGIAQGVATRPGQGMSDMVGAVTARQRGGNARLSNDLDSTLGRAVSPATIEQSLEQQRASLQPLYEAVTGLNQPVNMQTVYDQLRMAIPEEAGPTQRALNQIMEMVAPAAQNGQRTVRSNPREVLNVRQALDDLHGQLGETPKAQRTVAEYRRLVDHALAEAVPDIKILDNTFSNLTRESEQLGRGSRLLQTGPEAIRPEDLIAERQALTLPQREAQRLGLRAELDRVVGTKANDVDALKRSFMSDGDWNRVKLAEVFGGREADRILKSVDREVAFQDAYRKIVENSMTAQRLQGAAAVKAETAKAPSMRDTTLTGAVLGSVQKGGQKISEVLSRSKRASGDQELASALLSQGKKRDDLLKTILDAQQKRKAGGTSSGAELARVLLNLNAGAR